MAWKLSLLPFVFASVAAAAPRSQHWVGTWGTSPQLADEPQHVKGATIRELAKLSLGGPRLRLRLSNAYGAEPVTIGAVHLALHGKAAAIDPASDRAVTFHGKPSV